MAAPPSRRARLVLALALGAFAGWYRWRAGTRLGGANDFGQVWFGARALLAGADPYGLVGPGRAYPRPWPLHYPGPALVFALPFAPLPEQFAAACFAGLGVALCAWALTQPTGTGPLAYSRHRWGRLAACMVSMAMIGAVQLAQWAPWITAAAVLPWLGAVLVAKPTVGAAAFAARPSRLALAIGTIVTLVSLAVLPKWPVELAANARWLTHLQAPVTALPFGPLLLLALLRWRRPEARLLAALACVPQTLLIYEAVPLFLVTQSAWEAWALAVLTHVVNARVGLLNDYPTFDAWAAASAAQMVPLLYLPCLVMVLCRPNAGDLPAWVERTAVRALRALAPARR